MIGVRHESWASDHALDLLERYSIDRVFADPVLVGPHSWCVFDNTASGATIENALTMLGSG